MWSVDTGQSPSSSNPLPRSLVQRIVVPSLYEAPLGIAWLYPLLGFSTYFVE